MFDLTSYLNNNFSLSNFAAEKLSEVISLTEKSRGETFSKVNATNDKEYLLIKGICRSYIINPSGQEITLSFFLENSAISPNLTRCIDGKSLINLQTLSDSTLGIFSTKALMQLMINHREIEIWANSILQKESMQKVKKEINQNSLLAKERLIEFRHQYPALENKIAHPYIASYLGITNVSLSRLRKELASS